MAIRNLEQREKWVLGGAAAVLLFLGGYLALEKPIKEYERSKRTVADAKQALAQVQLWHDEIMAIRASQDAVRAEIGKQRNFNLYSHVNSTVRKHQLTDRSETRQGGSRRTQKEIVQVTLSLNGVSLEELVNLLHDIYREGNLVVVQRLAHLRPSADQKGLDCSIDFVAPRS
jgi:type II secretory pathway component PulM